jgi:hypothetical protein
VEGRAGRLGLYGEHRAAVDPLVSGEQLADAAGLSVGRVYQIRDGRR